MTDGEERTGRGDAAVPVGLALAVAAVALVAWLSSALPAGREVAQLPAAARAAVVERAVANLRELCRATARPREFCVEQARLALDQPECDAACRALAQGELAADTAVR